MLISLDSPSKSDHLMWMNLEFIICNHGMIVSSFFVCNSSNVGIWHKGSEDQFIFLWKYQTCYKQHIVYNMNVNQIKCI